MDREAYDAIGDAEKVPRHCPLYEGECKKGWACHPDKNGNALRILGDTDSFDGFCPEVLYHFKTRWFQGFPDHYLNCPEFSKWWWERKAHRFSSGFRRPPMSQVLRFEVFQRDQFTCQYCGRKAPEVKLEVDHRIPVADGGTDSFDNLITACSDCNQGKSNKRI